MGGRIVGLQDGGASSVVCGHETLVDILDGFVKKGVNANEFLFSKTHKSFFFGGDHSTVAEWCVHLPIWIGGEKGRIQCFIVDGSTPLLVGRPILKALKVKLDYDQDMCSVMGQDPTTALKGDRGEYLIALDDGLASETVDQDYSFDYITDDEVEDYVQEYPLDDIHLYLHMTGRRSPDYVKEQTNYGSEDVVVDGEWNPCLDGSPSTTRLAHVEESAIPDKLWKTLYHGIRVAHNDLNQAMDVAFRSVREAEHLLVQVLRILGSLSAGASVATGASGDFQEGRFRFLGIPVLNLEHGAPGPPSNLDHVSKSPSIYMSVSATDSDAFLGEVRQR